MKIDKTYNKLVNYIKNLENVYIAFSGGIDSTLLTKLAFDILKENSISITIISPFMSSIEEKDVYSIINSIGISHKFIKLNHLNQNIFKTNPKNKCYFCKKLIFEAIIKEAKKDNVFNILEGSNVDDLSDYRPGIKALKELGILSPYTILGITKKDVRQLSKEIGLDNWNKPSMSCLATRIPSGVAITKEILEKIDKSEKLLYDYGIKQFRVRYHGNLARIEVGKNERKKFFNEEFIDMISVKFKSFGFKFVSLDLEGYKTGNMNN